MNDNIKKARKVIFDLLKLIASKNDQIKYQKNVPIANVPAELICMWFDDHYHPDADFFLEAFTKEERSILECFSSFYEIEIKDLPDTNNIFILHQSNKWDIIVEKAKETIKSLSAVCNDI